MAISQGKDFTPFLREKTFKMADGTYCEFPGQLENAMIPSLTNFGVRSGQETLGDGHSKAAGFYIDQFANAMPVSVMEALQQGANLPSLQQIAGSQPDGSGGIMASGMPIAHSVPTSMYEAVMNYAMKPEKGLPPTPPGSPDEPKEMQGMQQNVQHGYHGNSHMHPASMVTGASSQQHLLAKPVPMRRLSEKRIAQARANLSSATLNPSPQPALIEQHAIGPEAGGGTPALARAIAAVQQTQKRPRSEKKPIPSEQKDNKYFERRKRNNHAAKKSRDARKAREDEIAIRASFLEKENAILRAQVATLREEANSLRQLLLQKRSRH